MSGLNSTEALHLSPQTHDGKWIKYSLSGTVVAHPEEERVDIQSWQSTGYRSNNNKPISPAAIRCLAELLTGPDAQPIMRSLHSATAVSNGYWTRSGLSGSIVVTASKDGWTFSPSSKTVSEPASDVNFEGTYSAGGLVSDADGSVVSSVKLDFSGGHVSVYTDPYGRWTRDGLYGDVTVTPSLLNWTFDPPSHNITRSSDQYNFTRTYTVSGCVTDQYGAGIADVLLFLGGGFGTARTGSTGFWSASKLSGNVTVTPAKTGLVFTPETVTVSGSSSNLDFVGNPVANAYAVSGRVIDSRDGSGLYKGIFHLQRRIRQNSKRRIWRLVEVWPVRHGYSHTFTTRMDVRARIPCRHRNRQLRRFTFCRDCPFHPAFAILRDRGMQAICDAGCAILCDESALPYRYRYLRPRFIDRGGGDQHRGGTHRRLRAPSFRAERPHRCL